MADTAINVGALMRFVQRVDGRPARAGAAGAVLSWSRARPSARQAPAKGFLADHDLRYLVPGPRLLRRALLRPDVGLASQLQATRSSSIPQQFINLLPFVLTLIILSVAAGRVRRLRRPANNRSSRRGS